MTSRALRTRRPASQWAKTGALWAGLLGGVAGLVVGLRVNPATAWFAIFELGLPSSILGGLVGLTSGAIAHAVGRKDDRTTLAP